MLKIKVAQIKVFLFVGRVLFQVIFLFFETISAASPLCTGKISAAFSCCLFFPLIQGIFFFHSYSPNFHRFSIDAGNIFPCFSMDAVHIFLCFSFDAGNIFPCSSIDAGIFSTASLLMQGKFPPLLYWCREYFPSVSINSLDIFQSFFSGAGESFQLFQNTYHIDKYHNDAWAPGSNPS